ncbi:MAG: hypothetical protein LQ352_004728, partial [Teloschistes flavicans]
MTTATTTIATTIVSPFPAPPSQSIEPQPPAPPSSSALEYDAPPIESTASSPKVRTAIVITCVAVITGVNTFLSGVLVVGTPVISRELGLAG